MLVLTLRCLCCCAVVVHARGNALRTPEGRQCGAPAIYLLESYFCILAIYPLKPIHEPLDEGRSTKIRQGMCQMLRIRPQVSPSCIKFQTLFDFSYFLRFLYLPSFRGCNAVKTDTVHYSSYTGLFLECVFPALLSG